MKTPKTSNLTNARKRTVICGTPHGQQQRRRGPRRPGQGRRTFVGVIDPDSVGLFSLTFVYFSHISHNNEVRVRMFYIFRANWRIFCVCTSMCEVQSAPIYFNMLLAQGEDARAWVTSARGIRGERAYPEFTPRGREGYPPSRTECEQPLTPLC